MYPGGPAGAPTRRSPETARSRRLGSSAPRTPPRGAARATTREEGHTTRSRRRGSSRVQSPRRIGGGGAAGATAGSAAGPCPGPRCLPRPSLAGAPGSTTSGATRQYLPELNRRQTRKWRSSTTSPSSTRAALTASAAGIAGSVASTRAPGPCDSHSLGRRNRGRTGGDPGDVSGGALGGANSNRRRRRNPSPRPLSFADARRT